MLDHVQPTDVAGVLFAVVAIGAGWFAIRRSRDLRRASALIARQRVVEAEHETAWEAQRADDRVLHDLLGSGVLRLDASLHITDANAAAHSLLGRPPGSLVGRTLLEAFLDRQVEGIARAARKDGLATGEAKLADVDGPTLLVRAHRVPTTTASGSSSRTSPSSAGCSASGPSSSTTCRTSCGRRSRPSASSRRR